MNDLVIQLTGEIQQSNFDEWKEELLTQLKSVNTELKTEADFATATDHVKVFKKAEKTLKETRESAIRQAADINALFTAIDDVRKETREVRLTLERQIRTRKEEIRDSHVKKGVDQVRELIAGHSGDFQLLDHSYWLDDDIFEEAIKGKSSTKGVITAVEKTVAELEEQLSAKSLDVKRNADVLDSLPPGHQALFQDRGSLLALAPAELDKTVDQRIARLDGADTPAPAETAPEPAPAGEKPDDGPVETFELLLTLESSEARATAIFNEIRDAWLATDEVTDIVLRIP